MTKEEIATPAFGGLAMTEGEIVLARRESEQSVRKLEAFLNPSFLMERS